MSTVKCTPADAADRDAIVKSLEEYKEAKIKAAKGELDFIKKTVEAHAGNGAYLQLLAVSVSGVNKDVDTYLKDKGLLTSEPIPATLPIATTAGYVAELRTGMEAYDIYDEEFATGMILAGAPVTLARIVKSTAAKESGGADRINGQPSGLVTPPFSYAHRVHPAGYDLGIMGINRWLHVTKKDPIGNPKKYTEPVLLASIAANVEVGCRILLCNLRAYRGNIELALIHYGPLTGTGANTTRNAYKTLYGQEAGF